MIVVSILASDIATLRARALAQLPFADAIELRLDALAHVPESDLHALIRALGKPVIAAVNGPDAFGTFTGTRADRFALLDRAARAGAAFVDVDWKEAPHQPAVPNSCRRIVSRHVLDGTPHDLASPFAELERASRPSDRLKLVTHAHNAEEGVRLLEFARTIPRDFIAFSSGERGSFTRVLAPIFGSCCTYAAPARIDHHDAGHPTAPGQLRADVVRSQWPAAGVTRATEIFAVLGLPARHSLSPRLHNAVFHADGRDAVYVAIEPDVLQDFVRECRSSNWRGFSVTAPFKEAAFSLADAHDSHSLQCSASNTLLRTHDGWRAFNTDLSALAGIVKHALGRAGAPPGGGRLLVVGTGGAARAAIAAARPCTPQGTFVASRNPERAAALAAEARIGWLPLDEIARQRFDVIVHCTPAGSRTAPNEIAVPLAVVRSAKVVIEAVYRPLNTPLVEAARAAGVDVVLGSDWFLAQAVEQALHFSSTNSDARALMQAELERALAEDGT